MNQNIYTIGMALFVGLIIISTGSFLVMGPVSQLQLERNGLFLFGWLMLTLYVVWLAILLPKPLGDKIF